MKYLKMLMLLLTLALVAVSCRKKDPVVADFDFSMGVSASDASTPVVVSVNIDKGEYNDYIFVGTMEKVDTESGSSAPVEIPEVYSGGEVIASGQSISFPNAGHRDFSVIGVGGGTFRITVTLKKCDKTVSKSNLFVVKDDSDDPIPSGDEVLISSFTVPGEGLEKDEAGNIILYRKTYNVANPFRFESIIKPSDATDPQLICSSSDVSVLGAYVERGNTFVLTPKKEGVAQVTVKAASGEATTQFGVRVKVDDSPSGEEVEVSEFTIPDLDSQYGRLCLGVGQTCIYQPTITPANATDKSFRLISGDNDVVSASFENGSFVLVGKYPGRTSVTIIADGGNGIVKTLPVMVYADVTVEAAFEELEATEAQTKTKTFPCKLKFTSDSPVAFPSSIIYTVSMKSIVNKDGKDSQTVSDKTDVHFFGNRSAAYNITEKILIPSYLIWRTSDYSYSLTLEVVRNNPLDPELWRITFNDVYKTQDAAIKKYIVNNLQ